MDTKSYDQEVSPGLDHCSFIQDYKPLLILNMFMSDFCSQESQACFSPVLLGAHWSALPNFNRGTPRGCLVIISPLSNRNGHDGFEILECGKKSVKVKN